MTLKTFVISQTSLFENYSRIAIQNKDFIKIKKQDIKIFYKFQQKIGQCSYGNIDLAKCKKTNQIRVIKTMKKSIMPQNLIRQFKSQMQILQSLDHPNIIKIYEIYQEQQQNIIHVVTQYCCGGSLIDSILDGIVFSQFKIKKILVQILSALNYLHRNKIVHRDLKLQNLVFLNTVDQSTSEENLQIKIIGFGSTCKIKSRINFLRNAVGTLSYMAPQIISEYLNQKSDMWSVGVIFYILVTGNSPFKGQNKQETIYNIRQLQLSYDQLQWKTVGGDCFDLIKRMLIKNPQKRISACSALGHSWFKDISFSNQIFQGSKSIIGNLQQYYMKQFYFQNLIQFDLCQNQSRRKKISQMFKIFDKNNDGSIDVQQLKPAYINFYGKKSPQGTSTVEQITYILSKIDKNKSGRIDLSEFSAAVYDRKKLFIKKYLEEAFDYFDYDCSGYIEKDQLTKILQGCDQEEFQQIINQIDSDADEKISKQQFLAYLMKMNFLY